MESKRGLRILLLEDNVADAELIVREVRRAGFQVVATRTDTKEEFLNHLVEGRPDVIIADYTLPQFSAIEAFELLKEHGHDTPVILVTGSQSEEVAVECMKQGADDYILKQSLTRLPAAISNVLEKKRIREQKEQAEAALRKSEEKFRLLFQHNPLPMFVYDVETLRLLEMNNAAVDHYGFSREEFTHMWITDLWTLDDLRHLQARRLQVDGPSPLEGQWSHRHKNGETGTVLVLCRPLEVDERKTGLIIAQDITERAQAEERLRRSSEQLRALSAHLQSVREEERTRIAREIHDELGQVLTAIRMDLSWLFDKLNTTKPVPKKLLRSHATSMTDLIDSTIEMVRKIATELRPRILDDLGLVAAIEWQSSEFQNRSGVRCTFKANVEEVELDRERSTAIFRILQESLTNVARHAGASEVRIGLTASTEELRLVVADNGGGITPGRISDIRSLGLLGMRERAHLLGGSVSLQPASEGGTVVTVQLPLTPSPVQREVVETRDTGM